MRQRREKGPGSQQRVINCGVYKHQPVIDTVGFISGRGSKQKDVHAIDKRNNVGHNREVKQSR